MGETDTSRRADRADDPPASRAAGEPSQVPRRRFVAGTGALGLLAAAPSGLRQKLVDASPAADENSAGYFFTADEMRTLHALCGALIPGPPVDRDPGALEAGVPVYIDLLLASFDLEVTPRIFAGGPFSDRSGSDINYFHDFIALDTIEERTWRTRIEGSRGMPEREWNGPVEGWQDIYRNGLARLDVVARRWFTRKPFHASPRWLQMWMVVFPAASVADFVGLAYRHCLEGMYGNPEYGGNRDLVGWRYTRWPGDTQPVGWSDEEVRSAGDGQGDPPPGTDATAAGADTPPNIAFLMRSRKWRTMRS